MPVHDRSTGKFAYYVQADATDDPVIADDSGPFMTFGAMEDSAESGEQAYYVGADGQYYPYS